MNDSKSVVPVLGLLGFATLALAGEGCVMTTGGLARFPTEALLRAKCAVEVTALDPRDEVSGALPEGNASDEVAATRTRAESILSFMGYEIGFDGSAPFEFRFRRTGFVYEDETRGGGCVVDYEVVDREGGGSVVSQGTFRKDSATYFAYYSARKSRAEIAAKYCREMVEALFYQAPDCRPAPAAPAPAR